VKLGRNDICWCGSGKKYKKCHLPLELSKPVNPFEIEGALRKSATSSVCMAGEGAFSKSCSRKIIASHTISRRAALSRIARNGHVYALSVEFSQLNKTGGRLIPVLKGINRTSIFNGFCSDHDDGIFKPIDALDPKIDSGFCCRLAYRAVSKELYLKRQMQQSQAQVALLQRGRGIKQQVFIDKYHNDMNAGMLAAVRDLEAYQASLEQAISSGEDGGWSHLVVRVQGVMPIATSSLFQPEHNLFGESLQDLSNLETPTQAIVFSALPLTAGGIFVLSFKVDEHHAVSFFESLLSLSNEKIVSYLVGVAFERCENLAIYPDWWDGLSNSVRDELLSAMNRGVSPFGEDSSMLGPLEFRIEPLPILTEKQVL
jgi:hypothetical protein